MGGEESVEVIDGETRRHRSEAVELAHLQAQILTVSLAGNRGGK